MRRHQIYLDDEQRGRLVALAAQQRTSVSAVIRRAVDVELSRPEDSDPLGSWQRAVDATAGIAGYLPDGRAYLNDLRASERAKQAGR